MGCHPRDVPKVVFIKNTPAPYRIPLLNQLAAVPDYDLTIYFVTQSKEHRNWAVNPSEFEFDYHVHTWRSPGQSVAAKLIAERPDAILIGGYDTPAAWVGAAFAKISGTPYIPFVGTWEESISRTGTGIDFLRTRFISSGSAWVAYGTESKKFLISRGADENRVYSAINTVDVESFVKRVRSASRDNRSDFYDVLYCGQLIARKNVGALIRAVKSTEAEVRLTIIGDGPLQKELKELAAGITAEVRFTGYIPREELFQYYMNADLVVLPSLQEVWGLVINEALSCGTPALVSTKCGCATDVIREGFNGEKFSPSDHEALSRLISEYATGEKTFASPEEIQQDALSRLGLENEVTAFDAAVRTVLE